MKRFMMYSAVLIAVCVATTALAKRSTPKSVESVTKDGIEYSAPHGRMGFVVAKWIKTNRIIWSKQIYVVKYEYNSGLERDVQSCFITSVKLKDKELTIANEKGSEFTLNIDTLQTETIKGADVIDYTKHKHPDERK